MPIYEFKCECGIEFEELCKNDEQEVKCSCGSANVSRRMSVPSIVTSSTRNTFSYRAKSAFVNGQEERRNAQEQSHMGANPYNQINDMPDFEGKIS